VIILIFYRYFAFLAYSLSSFVFSSSLDLCDKIPCDPFLTMLIMALFFSVVSCYALPLLLNKDLSMTEPPLESMME
jgi:hypothetical protein